MSRKRSTFCACNQGCNAVWCIFYTIRTEKLFHPPKCNFFSSDSQNRSYSARTPTIYSMYKNEFHSKSHPSPFYIPMDGIIWLGGWTVIYGVLWCWVAKGTVKCGIA